MDELTETDDFDLPQDFYALDYGVILARGGDGLYRDKVGYYADEMWLVELNRAGLLPAEQKSLQEAPVGTSLRVIEYGVNPLEPQVRNAFDSGRGQNSVGRGSGSGAGGPDSGVARTGKDIAMGMASAAAYDAVTEKGGVRIKPPNTRPINPGGPFDKQ
ncbi:hypothetical protein ACFY7Y_32425 [Streptomyces virginiae]|uniref:hypothetical protein n=1 Tax=Streptomyces virginiae TaxID=1961 RepID=UPI0036A94578